MAETDTDAAHVPTCFACGLPFKDGDPVYDEVNEGLIHAACLGTEPESFSDADGEPLKPGDPIPEPAIYRAETIRPPAALGEYRNFYRRADGAIRMGPAWRDTETAAAMRELEPGETFVVCQNMRFEDVPAFRSALATREAARG